MKPQTASEAIIERFPEFASQIEKLLRTSDDFMDIAVDYTYSRNKLASLSANPDTNKHLIKQYETTMLDLEEEIKEYLNP